ATAGCTTRGSVAPAAPAQPARAETPRAEQPRTESARPEPRYDYYDSIRNEPAPPATPPRQAPPSRAADDDLDIPDFLK
ncbi:MAG: hypothetical protein Q4F67_14550, partial [Propionibacteriaceae bacterium]|nr:hypothetical protein [Propionibacteriaceae bacterium]